MKILLLFVLINAYSNLLIRKGRLIKKIIKTQFSLICHYYYAAKITNTQLRYHR